MNMPSVHRISGFNFNISLSNMVSSCPELKGAEEKLNNLKELIKPVIYRADMEAEVTVEDRVYLDGGKFMVESSYLAIGLNSCKRATLMATTIGSRLSEYSRRCIEEGKLWEGTVADLFGSYAVEALTEEFYNFLKRDYILKGMHPSPRYSPGYGDWALEDQKRIVSILKTEPDIKVNSNHMLEPVKSITALIGWSDEPISPDYPVGDSIKGMCRSEHSCSNCKTWACKKQTGTVLNLTGKI
jgi:hypothetical protein